MASQFPETSWKSRPCPVPAGRRAGLDFVAVSSRLTGVDLRLHLIQGPLCASVLSLSGYVESSLGISFQLTVEIPETHN